MFFLFVSVLLVFFFWRAEISKTIAFGFESITDKKKNSKPVGYFKEACASKMKEITVGTSRGKLISLNFLKTFKLGSSQFNLRFSMAFTQALRTVGHPRI